LTKAGCLRAGTVVVREVQRELVRTEEKLELCGKGRPEEKTADIELQKASKQRLT
jgi:hypothetical protein